MDKVKGNTNEFYKNSSFCFKNRMTLKQKMEEIDFDLTELSRQVTIQDVFRDPKGKQCILQLVLQMKFQFKLYHHIRISTKDDTSDVDDTNLKRLMESHAVPFKCLEMLENPDHTEPQIYGQGQRMYARFDNHGISIDCESLLAFADPFLGHIYERLQDHQEDCSEQQCVYCVSLPVWEENMEDMNSLFNDFGNNSSPDGQDDFHKEVDFTSLDLYDQVPRATSCSEFTIEFKEKVQKREDYTWEEFREIVVEKFNILTEQYAMTAGNSGHPVALLYSDHGGNIKTVGCRSVTEARDLANRIGDISEDPFPVVFITPANNRQTNALPSLPCRKKMRQKCPSKVGVEDSPFLYGKLKTPEGRKPFEADLLFFLDTGADSGSIGYNLNIIRHFVLTVMNINNTLTPAIICKVDITNNMDDDIQVFDVDEDQNWNAVGLSVLKNYRMYLDIKNNKVQLGKSEDVTVKETEDELQVTFRKGGELDFADDSNGQNL